MGIFEEDDGVLDEAEVIKCGLFDLLLVLRKSYKQEYILTYHGAISW